MDSMVWKPTIFFVLIEFIRRRRRPSLKFFVAKTISLLIKEGFVVSRDQLRLSNFYSFGKEPGSPLFEGTYLTSSGLMDRVGHVLSYSSGTVKKIRMNSHE